MRSLAVLGQKRTEGCVQSLTKLPERREQGRKLEHEYLGPTDAQVDLLRHVSLSTSNALVVQPQRRFLEGGGW